MFRSLRLRLLPVLILVLALVVPTTGVLAAPAYQQDPLFQTYIVGLNPGTAGPSRIADEYARRLGGQRGQVFTHALQGFTITLPVQLVPILQRDPRIAFIEADQTVYAMDMPTGVDRIEADLFQGARSGGNPATFTAAADIAILDTGIAPHPDLNVVGSVNCTSLSRSGVNCRTGSNADGNGHGTHVAGTAAGIGSGGSPGVAAGARLWQVQVLNANGSGSIAMIVAGLDWVTARAGTISVVNMSLGCQCTSTALNTAINNTTNAGVVVVASAGNSAMNANQFSPASHPRVIAVSAMADYDGKHGGQGSPTCRSDADDSFASFSNFGAVVSIAAPGVCIRSTWPGGGYATLSGTSMASPHVAGAAALYIAEHGVPRNSSRWSVVKAGLQSADWSVAQNHTCGFTGGISAERMLMLADCTDDTSESPPVNTAPEAAITSPSNGATVSGNVLVQVNATDGQDAAGTLNVEVRVAGGQWVSATNSGSSYQYTWDSTTVGNGSHTVEARATDSGNLMTTAASITVTVDNPVAPPNTAPTAVIVAPAGGAAVEGQVTIAVEASDDQDADGALTVEARIDSGTWQPATWHAASSTYRLSWDTTLVANNSYTISARATDSGNLVTTASSVQVTVNNPPPPAATTMHVNALSGRSLRSSGTTWVAYVTVSIVDEDNSAVAGVSVQGQLSSGQTLRCTTGSNGQCTASTRVSTSFSSVTYQVIDAVHASLVYEPANNVVSSISVTR